jgi:hypothetical protein
MATGDAEKAVKAQRFTCSECAAEIKFDAGIGKLKCDHCGATRDIATGTGTVLEYDFFQGIAAAPKGLNTGSASRTSRCQECGANVVFPGGVTATTCTFCGSSKVLEQAENANAIRPESLVPFGVDKKNANQAFGGWLGGLWFRPNDLKHIAKVQELAGVYVPFWTYDAHVDSSWTADAGYYYYTTEQYTTRENGEEVVRERQVRHTRWEPAWGQRADDYDDLLVCASHGLPADLAAKCIGFDTEQLRPYTPEFLAGFGAEEYDLDLEGGFARAQDIIVKTQEKRCSQDVPGDTQQRLSVSNQVSDVTFKHVLLPVWIAAYRYRNKVFRFLVNGQTGEVVGNAPVSWVKIALFTLSMVALIIILVSFLGRSR